MYLQLEMNLQNNLKLVSIVNSVIVYLSVFLFLSICSLFLLLRAKGCVYEFLFSLFSLLRV